MSTMPSSGGPAPSLTEREARVLNLMAAGATYEAVSRELICSDRTASWIGQRVMKKLGAKSIAHAVLLGCQAGILDGRPQRHGDHAGFAAHRYRGEEPCDACWDGERAYRADRRAARKASMSNAA
ncbi:helix-turn-helix transcriptional regulator [Streptomyces sp. NPDC056982]|uniref:helix-turn-helix domain-containing protein n=1 Tax=Streptomyces sp. NPDC056982 TaxID=3345986 RepID=UPI003643C52E